MVMVLKIAYCKVFQNLLPEQCRANKRRARSPLFFQARTYIGLMPAVLLVFLGLWQSAIEP
jgi:hypothetical protein